MPVSRDALPVWVAACLSDGQLGLAPRNRWTKVLVVRDVRLTSTQTLIGLALATFMDDDGACRPSIKTLASAAKVNQSTAWRALEVLREKQWIEVQPGGPNRASRYQARYPEADPRIDCTGQSTAQDSRLHRTVASTAHRKPSTAQDSRIDCTPQSEVSKKVLGDSMKGAAPTGLGAVGAVRDSEGRSAVPTHDRFGNPIEDSLSVLDALLANPRVQPHPAEGYVWIDGKAQTIEDALEILGDAAA